MNIMRLRIDEILKQKKKTLFRVSCGDSDENRTRVTAVKGRCLNRLTTEPY